MPHQSNQPLPERTLILDNGAYTMKAGFASADIDVHRDCHIIPNCIARDNHRSQPKIFIGAQLDQCTDFAEMVFRRPVEKGYLVNWDGEMEIWKHTFFNNGASLHCVPHETNLVLTEAPNCPQGLQANCDQIIFEELEFASYYRCLGPTLNAYNEIGALFGDPPPHNTPAECLLLVDAGYSHTTITPLLHGRAINTAIRRLDIGGKFLTNQLKELISIRHYDLHNEPHLIGQIKEDTSFVSLDFPGDLERTWKGSKKTATSDDSIVLDYVLPDYTPNHIPRGFARPHDPTAAATAKRFGPGPGPKENFFPIGNERFAVPELLFSPWDVGMAQAGLPEVIVQSVACVPPSLWPALLGNVVVVGGSTRMPGFVERLERELRSLTPTEIVVRVRRPEDPITYTWLGGARMASDREMLKRMVVTRQEYEEHGAAWTARRFAAGPR